MVYHPCEKRFYRQVAIHAYVDSEPVNVREKPDEPFNPAVLHAAGRDRAGGFEHFPFKRWRLRRCVGKHGARFRLKPEPLAFH